MILDSPQKGAKYPAGVLTQLPEETQLKTENKMTQLKKGNKLSQSSTLLQISCESKLRPQIEKTKADSSVESR